MLLKIIAYTLILAFSSVHSPVIHQDILQRVAITGASVTTGMGLTTPPIKGDLGAYPMNFKHIFEGMITVPYEEVGFFGDMLFFRGARENGKALIQQIIDFDPTLVIGIDFLFWFGYGSPPPESDVAKFRMEKLNYALSLIEQIQVPIVIGDIPDVRATIGKLLSQRKVPSEEVLSKLNERIHAWAAQYPNVYVLPVHAYWEQMMRDEEIVLFGYTWKEDTRNTLLQKDMLHMTLEGTVTAGLLVAKTLQIDGLETNPKVIMKKAASYARQTNNDMTP